MNEKEKENIIGYSYDIFKSFISMNMNDFKNFISLSKDDKDSLLNKLFNLNELNEYLSIVNELDKANQKNINEYENIINTNNIKISDYKQTIKSITNTIINDKEKKLTLIKNKYIELKPKYVELKKEISNISNINKEINTKFNKLKNIKENKINNKIKLNHINDTLIEKIKTYESGICPICNSNLKNDTHISELNTLKKQLNDNKIKIIESEKFLNRCILEDIKLTNKRNSTYKKSIDTKEQYNNILNTLKQLKLEENSLKVNNEENIISTDNLNKQISKLVNSNNTHNNLLFELEQKSNIYDELKNILSYGGIRKSLINNAIGPINNYIKKFLHELESEHTVKLSNEFDATIYELGIKEINPETLSRGEDRKINIAISLSYLKLILEMKHSNIIFLDEVFDGVSMKNIILILKILKKLAEEHNTNIIVVAHGISEMKKFESIKKNFTYTIEATKDIFSDLKITKL